jgi:hypothetical protein
MGNNLCDIRIFLLSGPSVESRTSENIRSPILEARMYKLCCLIVQTVCL